TPPATSAARLTHSAAPSASQTASANTRFDAARDTPREAHEDHRPDSPAGGLGRRRDPGLGLSDEVVSGNVDDLCLDEVAGGELYLRAQIRYALVLSKQGKLDAARAHLQQVEVDSESAKVQLLLTEAQMLRDAKQPRAAFDLSGNALQSMPDQPELLYDYAMLAEKLDRLDLLEDSLTKLIKLKPDHAHAYNALGYSLAERNLRLPEAQELIEKALQLSPEDPFIMDSMGWVLYRAGKSTQALEYLRKAYTTRPDPEIAAHLGEVLWVAGERSEADKIWLEASKKAPDNDALNSTIKRFKP
ncbi:MAG: tetratricopeptide repeat protein, partial [Burkholderiales bacterium]|nr:tetratricopeptide repeat protein [Burkholderiales bacterium]